MVTPAALELTAAVVQVPVLVVALIALLCSDISCPLEWNFSAHHDTLVNCKRSSSLGRWQPRLDQNHQFGWKPFGCYSFRAKSISLERVKMEAYCVKCKQKREIQNPQAVTLKNGRPATQGVYPVCGTKVFRIRATP